VANLGDTETLSTLFRIPARGLLAKHGWCLHDETSLAHQAAALLVSVPTPTAILIERTCIQVYAQTLYTAIWDPACRETAARELHSYLLRIARYQWPELADDAAQAALELVFKNAHTCRDPAAFLMFAINQLRSAIKRVQAPWRELPLESIEENNEEEGLQARGAPQWVDWEDEVDEREATAELLRWLRSVIEANPRAKMQILAVILKYLDELDDEEIARELNTSVDNVYVLRSRGLNKLRMEYQQRFEKTSARFRLPDVPGE
jgi:RNA polymerase sigma factor (sigma-70 family)